MNRDVVRRAPTIDNYEMDDSAISLDAPLALRERGWG